MAKELQCDEATIIVGHSSGAQAAMRYSKINLCVKPCPNGKCFTVNHAKTCFRVKHINILQSDLTA